jgi:hypothetical protein
MSRLSGGIIARGHVPLSPFVPKRCNVSYARINLGDTDAAIIVAWSLLVTDKDDVAVQGWVPNEEGSES